MSKDLVKNSKGLSKDMTELLRSVMTTAGNLGIEKIVIDGHSVRGDSQTNGTMMILPFQADTTHEFGSIGISRVDVLRHRLGLLDTDGQIVPEYKTRDSGDKFVFRMVLKQGKTSVDFKCADPATIRCPKGLNDPVHFGFDFTKADIELMSKAKSVMGAETVNFNSKDGTTVSFAISASEGDVLTHELTSGLEVKGDVETFNVTYKNKILFPVLKGIMDQAKKSAVAATITKRGILRIDVNGIPAYVFPEV